MVQQEILYQDYTCTLSKNNTLKNSIHNDIVRYRRKGYGLFFAMFITLSYFYLFPKILKYYWLDLFGENYMVTYYLVSMFYAPFLNLIGNLFMWFVYVSKLQFFEQYRLYPEKKWPWEEDPKKWKKQFNKAMKMILINSLLIPIPLQFITYFTGVHCRFDIDSFPGYFEIITQIVFFMVIEDICFYTVHRLFHHPKLYKYHKIHHEFYNSVSIASIYSHPLENIASGVVPSVLGFIILGDKAHFAVLLIWVIIRITEAIDGHCGYEFSWSPCRLIPFSASSESHNYHHSHNIGIYASFFSYLDTIFGTNKDFYEYKAKREREEKQRNISKIKKEK